MARKTRTGMTWGIVLVVVLLGVLVLGQFGVLSPVAPEGTPADDAGQPAGVTCSGEITPDLTINVLDKDNVGTAITEATNSYRKKGTTAWTAWTGGTAITDLEPFQTYEFVQGTTSASQTDDAYGEMFEYTVKCLSDETIEKFGYNDEIETSLSATFYNKDDNAAAQTFTAGETLTVEMRLKAGTDEYFGNPTLDNPNVFVIKLNSSEWDRPEEVRIKGGATLSQVSTPLRYDQQAAGFIEYAYELPAIGDKEVSIELDLNADDSNAPSIDGTAYIYAGNYYIDADDGQVKVGVEDEDNNAVGTDAPDSLTLDFTA